MNKWTEEEIKIIEDNYNIMSDEELHKLIPSHSKISIETKRRTLGLTKPIYKKYSFNNVVEEFSKRENYILLSTQEEYVHCNSKMRYICKIHENMGEQAITLNHIQSGRGCYYCGRVSTTTKRRIEFDKEEDEILCKYNNFKYIDTVRDRGIIKIVFVCKNHTELGEQMMVKSNMLRGIKGCKYCSGKQLPKWYVLKRANEVNPYIQLLEPYKNLTTSMKCICTKHNHETRKSMQQILKGEGCYFCGIKKLSENSFKTLDEFKERINNKNPNITALEYYGYHNYAKFKCKICEHEWSSNATSIRQCPKCTTFYTGERKVSQLLDLWDISYKEQFRFDDCRNKRPLPFDFYLTYNNVCIEFDGRQHFEQRNGWTQLENVQKHDRIKNEYCKKNDIPLIRIPYWEQDDLEYYLFDKLVNCNVLEENKNIA